MPCGGIVDARSTSKIEFRKECWFEPAQGTHASPSGCASAAIRKVGQGKDCGMGLDSFLLC